MADINWGLLQSSPAPAIRASEPQAQASSPMSAPAPGAGVSSLNNLAQTQLERQKLGEQTREFNANFGLLQNQDARAQQMQPGALASQGLLNQGQSLNNQKTQSEIAAQQYQVQMRQKEAQAYTEGKARGGTEGGLDAIQETKFQNGDVEGGTKFADWRQQAKEKLAGENQKEMLAATDAIHSAVDQEKSPIPPFKDPQTGQQQPGNPGISALENYQQKYPLIQKLWPGAPAPSSFKDNNDFKNNFVTPVMGTALPIKEQVASDQKAQQNSDIYKANLEVKSATTDLNNAINQHGANSQEARDAAQTLQNSQMNAQRIAMGGATGNNSISMVTRSLSKTDTNKLIKQHTPQATVQPTSQTFTPPTVEHNGKTYTKINGQWTY